jgi:hypothetical protein
MCTPNSRLRSGRCETQFARHDRRAAQNEIGTETAPAEIDHEYLGKHQPTKRATTCFRRSAQRSEARPILRPKRDYGMSSGLLAPPDLGTRTMAAQP